MLVRILICLLFYCAAIHVQAQTGSRSAKAKPNKTALSKTIIPAYRPTRTEILVRYKQAEQMESLVKNTVFKTGLQAHWQEDGETFWYRNFLKDSTVEYFVVEAANGKKEKAFDQARLAQALTIKSGVTFSPTKLLIDHLYFENTRKQITFLVEGNWWSCNLENYECTYAIAPLQYKANNDSARGATTGRNGFTTSNDLGPMRRRAYVFRSDSLSPDKQWIAYIKGGNVYAKQERGGEEFQMTSDGTKEKPYGHLVWSPDSKVVVGYKINPVENKKVHYVLSSASGTRGELKSRGYAQPGDENTTYEMYLFSIADKKGRRVNTDLIDFGWSAPNINWRNRDSKFFTWERVDRGHQRFRIIEVNTETAETRELVDEKTSTFIFDQRIFTHYLPETSEIIWVTEKDGWRHIYLLDERTGTEKIQVTKGDWVVREIDSVDKQKREIWFRASGMHTGEDPYYIHYYRIGFDGKNLVRLTEANANHRVSFSPNRKYYIDQYSRVDQPPIMELRRTEDGEKIAEIEKADISAYLALGIKFPQPFVAKGRDGKTDIWGVVFRPSKFDPKKRYPIIEQIYAGPQDSFVPKNFTQYGEPQSLAELGFIVVQIDGMGTYNRSKAFHDVCWQNLADAGFPDRILWMKALAAKYPYADTSRVGLYGTSAGGQNSLGGLLFHPHFYKAAVSACGCHDNRVDKQWWNEQWMGYPVGKHYDEQSNVTNANKLQGKLLLIVGEADENVPPESTYRVADALIKAGKDFDFLAIPGMGHSDGGLYGRKKKRDFFVKHLLGVEPPNRNVNELAMFRY